MCNGEFIQQLTQLTFTPCLVLDGKLKNGPDIIFHGKAAEDRRLLGKISDAHACPFVHGQCGDIFTIERDGPLIGGNQPGDHVEHRRFARTIGAQKANGFPAMQLK